MRIISDFHDYYDVGMKNGIDPQLPYMRYRVEEILEKPIFGRLDNLRWDGLSLFCHYGAGYDKFSILFFGFAGKVYPVFKHDDGSGEVTYCFDFDKIPPDIFDDAINQMLSCGRNVGRKRAEKDCLTQIQKELLEIFALKDDKRLLGLFNEFKTAIFLYWLDTAKVVVNERLNQYGFQKVLPPMQAFQELEMYVGACLTKPTIEEPLIPDKVKVEIHGFDKHSFRKDKNKNKK